MEFRNTVSKLLFDFSVNRKLRDAQFTEMAWSVLERQYTGELISIAMATLT